MDDFAWTAKKCLLPRSEARTMKSTMMRMMTATMLEMTMAQKNVRHEHEMSLMTNAGGTLGISNSGTENNHAKHNVGHALVEFVE